MVPRQNTGIFPSLISPSLFPLNLPALPPLRLHPHSIWMKRSAECLVGIELWLTVGDKWWSRDCYNTGFRLGPVKIVWSIQGLRGWSFEDAGSTRCLVQGCSVHCVGSLRAFPGQACVRCRFAFRTELCVNREWKEFSGLPLEGSSLISLTDQCSSHHAG